MGGYFNHFFEAEGEKYDENMQLTTHEPDIKYIATWGEGSSRARNLDRYGHVARKTFFTEGEEGTVQNWGRQKPKLKQDIRKIKAALSNTGCMNLEDYHKKANIEFLPMQLGDIQKTEADISLLESKINYVPKISIEDGISKFIDWYKEYYGIK